jgi:hypothetical protein
MYNKVVIRVPETPKLCGPSREVLEALLNLSAETEGEIPLHWYEAREVLDNVLDENPSFAYTRLNDNNTFDNVVQDLDLFNRLNGDFIVRVRAIKQGGMRGPEPKAYYRTEVPQNLKSEEQKEPRQYENGRGRPSKFRVFDDLFLPSQADIFLMTALRKASEGKDARMYWRPEQILNFLAKDEGIVREYVQTHQSELEKQFKTAKFEGVFTLDRVTQWLYKLASEHKICHATVGYDNVDCFRYKQVNGNGTENGNHQNQTTMSYTILTKKQKSRIERHRLKPRNEGHIKHIPGEIHVAGGADPIVIDNISKSLEQAETLSHP